MKISRLTQRVLKTACTAALLSFPLTAQALDTCSPAVTYFTPDNASETEGTHSFLTQASRFFSQIPEQELQHAVENVPAGIAIPVTYLFNGSDTRWRLDNPLVSDDGTTGQKIDPTQQAYYLIPSKTTDPYGTIVVIGTNDGPGYLANASMAARLEDGRAVILEPQDPSAHCRLFLETAADSFLDSISNYTELNDQKENWDEVKVYKTTPQVEVIIQPQEKLRVAKPVKKIEPVIIAPAHSPRSVPVIDPRYAPWAHRH